MNNRWRDVAVSALVGLVVSAGILSMSGQRVSAKTLAMAAPVVEANPEIERLASLQIRNTKPGVFGEAIADPARERISRIHDLYREGSVKEPIDLANAANVLVASDDVDDLLLAHDLAVAALAGGRREAAWAAAASEDRMLLALGRPQRFGTQLLARPGERLEPAQVQPGLTRHHRDLYARASRPHGPVMDGAVAPARPAL